MLGVDLHVPVGTNDDALSHLALTMHASKLD